MADLSAQQAALVTALTGADSSGVETNYVNADANGNLQVVNYSNGPVTPGTVAATSELAGGQFNTTLPVLTTTQQVALQVDSSGRLIISPIQSSPLPATGSAFSFGDVTTASAAAFIKIERTAYIEQTTNAQRSIASSSASDTSAGTGARTVTITYLDSTGAGPFTETVTLNGVTFVNTVSATICFIEKIVVATVGSTGSNVGTLTLKAATAGGGVTIGTIGPTSNQTFWAHHYIPTGKTSYISGFSFCNSSTANNNGAVFALFSQNPTSTTSPLIQISDTNSIAGTGTSTTTRTYVSTIQVVGPSRVTAYVLPNTNTSVEQRASFDYIDN